MFVCFGVDVMNEFTDMNVVYLKLILSSCFLFLVISCVKWIIKKILGRMPDEKVAYKTYSVVRIVGNVVLGIALTIL